MIAWLGRRSTLLLLFAVLSSLGLAIAVGAGAQSDPAGERPTAEPDFGRVDGDIPDGDIAALDAIASDHPAVQELRARSPRVDLLWANTYSDPKDPDCAAESSCAMLTYYAWDLATGLATVISLHTNRVIHEPTTSPQLILPAYLRDHAVAIARADADIQQSIREDAEVLAVSDVTGYGSCATNLCAVVAFSSSGGPMESQTTGVVAQVDLNREMVVYAKTINGLVDRRFD